MDKADLIPTEVGDSLRLSELRLRLALETGRMGTWELDIASGTVHASPALAEIHGLPPNTVYETLETFIATVHPEDRERLLDSLRHDHQIEYRIVLSDGSIRWVEGRGKLFSDLSGRPQRMIGVCTDISQRKGAEQALQRTSNQFEQIATERTRALESAIEALRISNRELEDFASVASHDLQEPLRKIQAFGGRLQARAQASLDDESLDYLRRMLNAAGRMQRLITDLLEFSRVTTRAQPFSTVDLNVILADVLDDLELTIERNSGQITRDELATLDADPIQMQQLLLNLIGNALKFHRPQVPPKVAISAERSETVCRIRVGDNGIGFDEKYLDRIFNVFQRLHGRGEYEGTGIGLALCRKIAERHGGSITARSTPGVGSTFIVTLPLRHSPPENANVP